MPEPGLCDDRVRRVAGSAPHAYLAVETARGPHVTPVLFAIAQDRIWFAIQRDTLKARVLAKRPRVGVLLPGDEAAVSITGDAALLDPLRPASLAGALPEMARAPGALPLYGLRNGGELAGFARDAARARGAAPPPALALVAVRPRALAIVPPPPRVPARRGSVALPDLPAGLAALAAAPGDGVLAWPTSEGPLVLPAAWQPAGGRAAIPWAPLRDAAAPREAAACLCLDAAHGSGPAAKEGVLLRGPGRITPGRETATVTLEAERVTWWSGFETASVG
jgi:hypothetical protein